ncbi:MAG: DUF1549 domain-containing protein [Planctomycetota bacterium]
MASRSLSWVDGCMMSTRLAIVIIGFVCGLSLQAGELRFENQVTQLSHRFDRLQLVLTNDNEDVTEKARYESHPADIVSIDNAGRVTPLTSGDVVVTATLADSSASLPLKVAVAEEDVPGFDSHLMPLLGKHACNTCHGKPNGQNGFQISLFGFDPESDYRSIVQGGRGRRITTAIPSQSLMLQKATAQIPHGGGERFRQDSLAYHTWHAWIGSGAPDAGSDFQTDSVRVLPAQRTLGPKQSQQLCVIAISTDGRERDVTHLAQFRADATELATVSTAGRVETDGRSGQFAVVVKFDGKVDTFRGTRPFGQELAEAPEPRNFIDKAVFKQLASLGLAPAETCSDRTFLRRVTLDLAGRLPTLEEYRVFSQSSESSKRDQVIEQLLQSEDYASYFANKWLHLLRNRRLFAQQRRSSFAFHHWIRESFRTNQPYDQFVRQIVAANGDMTEHPPATWYRELKEPTAMVENLSQLFLGVRITCAKCHHHPFEKWSQKDYYSLAAFFSTINRKFSINGTFRDYEARIYHKYGEAKYRHPETREWLKPAVLGGPPLDIDADVDPRSVLVDWMTSDENPYFATVLVNRYWKHFFGRGIVDPEDDLRDSNPAFNPALLASLREEFIASGFDRKALARSICQSRTYQLAAAGSDDNLEDVQSFSRYYPQRLDAEVLYDAIDDLFGTSTQFKDVPASYGAVDLPDTGSDNEFLELFGKPKAESSCDCERVQDGDLRQSLVMLTSSDLLQKLGQSTARPAVYAKGNDDRECVQEMYEIAFSRPPSQSEMRTALEHITRHQDRSRAYQDLLWVLINTKEFLYNH